MKEPSYPGGEPGNCSWITTADEFKLHIVGGTYGLSAPALLAFFDGVADIVLPILLVSGLATRFSAFELLIMTGVIQLVVPEDWANFHLPWATLAVAIIALGPGRLSLDYMIERQFIRRVRLQS